MSCLLAAAPLGNRVASRSRLAPRATRGRTGALPWSTCAVTRARRVVSLCGTMKTVREQRQPAPVTPDPYQTTTFRPNPFFATNVTDLVPDARRCDSPTTHRFSGGPRYTGLSGGLSLRFTPSGDAARVRIARWESWRRFSSLAAAGKGETTGATT
jgi:hypothetical protein